MCVAGLSTESVSSISVSRGSAIKPGICVAVSKAFSAIIPLHVLTADKIAICKVLKTLVCKVGGAFLYITMAPSITEIRF